MKKIQNNARIETIINTINELIDKVKYLEGIKVGPGLELKKSSTGMGIFLSGGRVANLSAPIDKTKQESYKTLSFTQNARDTDSYDSELDDFGVAFKILHEVAYNESSGTLTLRFREVKSSYIDYVSEESEEVIITTVEVCD